MRLRLAVLILGGAIALQNAASAGSLCIRDYGPLDAAFARRALPGALAFDIECDDGIRFAPTMFGNFNRFADSRLDRILR